MNKEYLLKALDLMLKGKSLRLSEKGKQSLSGYGYTGQWFTILAINCDGTVNICSNDYEIAENEPLDTLKL